MFYIHSYVRRCSQIVYLDALLAFNCESYLGVVIDFSISKLSLILRLYSPLIIFGLINSRYYPLGLTLTILCAFVYEYIGGVLECALLNLHSSVNNFFSDSIPVI